MKVLILLISVFCVSQASDAFQKYIEQAIDYNVHPCDDFYRHSCRKTTTQDLKGALSSHIQSILDKTHIKMGTPALEKFTNVVGYFSRRNFTAQFVRQFKEQYLNRCQNQSLEVFLKEVQTLYPESSDCINDITSNRDCQSASQQFASCVESFPVENFQSDLNDFVDDAVLLNWIDQYGSSALNRINSTLLDVKQIAIQLIKNTPWLNKYGLAEEFQKYAEKTVLANYTSLKNARMALFERQSKVYNNCSSNSVLQNSPRHVLCLLSLLKHSELVSYVLDPIQIDDNAYNMGGALHFYFTYFYVAQYITNPAEYMAYAGFTVGHEFGHSIVTSTLRPLKYSEIVKSCIQDQFKKSCSYFAEFNCTVLLDQIGDNGSDLIGFQIIYDLFKQEIGEKLHDQVPEYKQNMTYEQLFFYAYGAQWCKRYPDISYDDHQAHITRTNAVLIQHEEFQKAFGCSDQTRMVQSNNGKCHIFGPDAPQEKGRNFEGF